MGASPNRQTWREMPSRGKAARPTVSGPIEIGGGMVRSLQVPPASQASVAKRVLEVAREVHVLPSLGTEQVITATAFDPQATVISGGAFSVTSVGGGLSSSASAP